MEDSYCAWRRVPGFAGVVVVLPVVGVHAGASLAGNDCSDASTIGS
jgi:hypothetical protein